jgi:hypothetical protein
MGYGGKEHDAWTRTEGRAPTQNLSFARHTYPSVASQPRPLTTAQAAQRRTVQQEEAARKAHFARWGPEFHIAHEEPQHVAGSWQARLFNPHLEHAVLTGQTRTPSGADLVPHPEGGVIYRFPTIVPSKTWEGYTHFVTGMGRDAVAHIANYLAGTTQPQMPPGFMQGVQWRRPRPRPTEAEQAPTPEAPWGYGAGGGKRLPTSLPIDPLADPNWEPRPDILAHGHQRPPGGQGTTPASVRRRRAPSPRSHPCRSALCGRARRAVRPPERRALSRPELMRRQ